MVVRREEDGKLKHALVDATAGAISGGISRTVTSPLDVIKIRFQVQLEPTSSWALLRNQISTPSKYTGIFQATKDIYKEEGFRGFWRGNVPALLMVMPYTAIQFTVLQKLKSFAAGSSNPDDHKYLSPTLSYLSGALAGVAATMGSYPFDLVRTILASQGEPKVFNLAPMIHLSGGQQNIPRDDRSCICELVVTICMITRKFLDLDSFPVCKRERSSGFLRK